MAPNEELVNEIINLLSDWKATDDKAHEIFVGDLKTLVEKHDSKLEKISNQSSTDEKKLADEIKAQDKIAKIKDQINNI